MFKPTPNHSIRASYNNAFVSPSFINNYLNQDIQFPQPIDLSPLEPLIGPAAALVPPPFLPTVNAFGNADMKEQSTDAWELAYTGTFGGKTTVGLAAYQSDTDNNINFTYLYPPGTPGYPPPTYYSVTNPARGVTVPTATTPSQAITLSPILMGILAQIPPQFGGPIQLPYKAATYLNLGPIRNRGIEASIDQRFNSGVVGLRQLLVAGHARGARRRFGADPLPGAGDRAARPRTASTPASPTTARASSATPT